MKPTEVLVEEHKAIKTMLRVLNEVASELEAGEETHPSHLDMILEFIKLFADRCHHGKEEDLLFPAMEKAGIPREGGPLGVMLTEHKFGREYVKGMSESAEKLKRGDRSAAAQFAENARQYVKLLSQHVDKEDNILYPMADKNVPEKKQDELLREFDKVETERMGAGKHEELHKTLRHLVSVYLK